MRSEENPFGDCVTALELIRDRFEYLVRSGTDPKTVIYRARCPIKEWVQSRIEMEQESYTWFEGLEDPGDEYVGWCPDNLRFVLNDDSFAPTHADIEIQMVPLSDLAHLFPGLTESKLIAYAHPDQMKAISGPSSDASVLIMDRHELLRGTLLREIPADHRLVGGEFAWADVVFEVGRFQLPSIPTRVILKRLSQDALAWDTYDDEQFVHPWTMEPQPDGWRMSLERFCTASVHVLNLLIEWGRSGVCTVGGTVTPGSDASPLLGTPVGSPHPVENTGQPVGIRVSIDPPQITIAGIPYALEPDGAVYLQWLINSGSVRSDREFKNDNPGYESARIDRVRKGLPQLVRSMIETDRRGSRWIGVANVRQN